MRTSTVFLALFLIAAFVLAACGSVPIPLFRPPTAEATVVPAVGVPAGDGVPQVMPESTTTPLAIPTATAFVDSSVATTANDQPPSQVQIDSLVIIYSNGSITAPVGYQLEGIVDGTIPGFVYEAETFAKYAIDYLPHITQVNSATGESLPMHCTNQVQTSLWVGYACVPEASLPQ